MTWIKCSERLPDKVGEILVKIEGKTFLGFALQSSSLPRYIPLDMVYCEFPYQFKDEDCFEAIASQGVGVMPTFLKIAEKIIQKII